MLRLAWIWLAATLAAATLSAAAPLELYIDADFSKSEASAVSITLGVQTALAEAGNQLGGEAVTLRTMDHRGNVKRSYRHMQDMHQSDTALLMIGGMQSPSYLTHRDYINDNRLLTLLPWSAAGPITRARAGQENWFFRLSVDDTKSGPFLAEAALTRGKCRSVAVLLLDTGWGKANRGPLVAALDARGLNPQSVSFIPTLIGDAAAGTLAETVARGQPECLILLASWRSSAIVVTALHDRLPHLRIFSHWGIMGGAFDQLVPHAVRNAHALSVLQTCGLRRERAGSPVLQQALTRAPAGTGNRLSEIAAPVGFVHGYDLTRLLIAAADQAAATEAWAGDIRAKRLVIRTALENLDTPVKGILKTYEAPYAPYTPARPDAHEALGLTDLCLARFDATGQLEDDH